MIKPISTYKLPENLDQEINGLAESITRFKSGDMSPTEFKVIRVPFGMYEQRKKDTYMVRVRNAGSVVTPEQLEKIAEISRKHAANYIHLTTRQEIQLHYVLIDSLVDVARELKTVGLSPRGGGGNTVRNIMAQEDAGIAEDEVFDVSPYAIALTTRFIAEPDSWNLPRKFKIAFSGSSDDRGYATIHDVGYIAKIKDGQKGFKVYFAGGMGAKTQVSLVLFDFIPDTEVYNVAKAVKNIFYNNGNRKNKHAARLRFLVKTLGEEELKRITLAEYDAVKTKNCPPLDVQEIENGASDVNIPVEDVADQKDFALWRKRFVQKQKQTGAVAVIVPAHLGHVDCNAAVALAQFLKPFGNNTIRIRKDQNFLLRNIPEKYLPNLYNVLKANFTNFNRPFIIDKIIACAGASTCQLGICLSPGAATAAQEQLKAMDVDLDGVDDAVFNISGCPNSCGQHHAADIGFYGKVARNGDHVYPAFNVISGAKIKEDETEFAEKVGDIAARALPLLLRDAIKKYTSVKRQYANFRDYIRSPQGKADLTAICEAYKTIPDYDANQQYYMDWGTDKAFSVAERGKGECSAGIFDLIETDLGNIQQSLKVLEEISKTGGRDEQKGQYLKDVIFYSSRVLLVAKALQPKNEKESYNCFREHFINAGLVDASFDDLLHLAEISDLKALAGKADQVKALADRMKLLYDVMTPGFEFKLPDGETLHHNKVKVEAAFQQGQAATAAAAGVSTATSEVAKPDLVKDFRGVACPMNFVKTKMELAKIQKGQLLEIWLDDGQPIDNVPGSVRGEGHKILEQKRTGNYWMVLIEKV